MLHVGLDVGSVKTQVCIRQSDGTLVFEGPIRTSGLREYFFSELRELGGGSCHIVLEACAESFAIASWAREAGHEVRIVPSHFSRLLGIGEGGIKTDQRDARALSEASCRVKLRSVHIRSAWARETISMTSARGGLIRCRTAIINSVRGWLRTLVLPGPRATPKTFPQKLRAGLKARGMKTPAFIEAQLAVIESLNTQLKTLEDELETRAAEHEVCSLLMTMPGVGTLTALEFCAVIDDPKRFPSSDKVGAYLGLSPGEKSSSLKQRRTSITKAGPPQMRFLLVQAAWSFARYHKEGDRLGAWYAQLSERRCKQRAVIALARRIAITLWGMWRHGTTYRQLSEQADAA